MEWEIPTFEEVNLSCEINSYVNAELPYVCAVVL